MYLCSSCGYGSPSKLGKCPNCEDFGTFVLQGKSSTEKLKKAKNKSGGDFYGTQKAEQLRTLNEVEYQRIFGNGLHSGGVYLIAGEPWVGKSTLILQLLSHIQDLWSIGYFSGEEHVNHIEKRLDRVAPKIKSNTSITHSNNLETILEDASQSDIVIIDSIQTIQSQSLEAQSGSPTQVRYCADQLVQLAKATNTTVIIIGHVTKGGEIAWPKYLEHIVDMVCYLEGDRLGEYRFLRTKKNRFWSIDETAIFHMEANGLIPAHNIPLSGDHHAGMLYSIAIDNGRPMVIQIEILVSKTKGKYPQRVGIGINTNRLDMIIAIVEKYSGINLSFSDVYINIPGEIEFLDSGIDLAIAAGLYMQYKNLQSMEKIIIMGELWLGGQIVTPKQAQKRIQEIPTGRTTIDWRNNKQLKQALQKIT